MLPAFHPRGVWAGTVTAAKSEARASSIPSHRARGVPAPGTAWAQGAEIGFQLTDLFLWGRGEATSREKKHFKYAAIPLVFVKKR